MQSGRAGSVKFIGNRFAMRYAFHEMCPGHFAIMNPGDKYFISRYPSRYGPKDILIQDCPMSGPLMKGIAAQLLHTQYNMRKGASRRKSN